MTRICAWCKGPIGVELRADAVCCSKRCRQARHRFATSVGVATAGGHDVFGGHPRRLAYADPPYPGRAARYYLDHPDYAGEVDHAALIASLSAEYDAWALSTAADALPDVLALCPPGVRVAAWHRGARANKAAQTPLNSWEPVIYAGAIRRVAQIPDDASRRNSLSRVDSFVHRPAARTTDPGRVVGAKPAAFWRWIFELLGATPDDDFTDIFTASGAGDRAWAVYASTSSEGRRVASTRSAAIA